VCELRKRRRAGSGSWVNDTVVTSGAGGHGAARDRPAGRPDLVEALLPEQARRLPAVDAYLDDECLLAPWGALFDRRLGRPSVPVDTLLRLLYLKHR
jgi:transposase, IS5 family